MYIEHTMQFLDAIRRVLRDDGVVFWNISDCYWTGKGQSGQKTPEQQGQRHDDGRSLNMAAQQLGGHDVTMPRDGKHPVIKSLDMCMIPYRFALVAQERGWYVRADIIWYKNNPMPESINSKRWVKRGDGLVLKTGSWRPTTAHEYIFMLTKTDNYYSDIEAAKEKRRGHTHPRGTKLSPPYESAGIGHENWASYMGNGDSYTTRNPRSVWHINGKPFSMGICGDCGRVYNGSRYRRLPFDASRRKRVCICGSTNWTSHFATFPDDLPQKCILATTSDAGCCSKCGAPVLRIVEVKPSTMNIRVRDARHGVTAEEGYKASDKEKENYGKEELGWTKTVGWKPECQCGAPLVPCTVLDPFAGSGTTLMVAKRLGRRSIGIDLSDEYTGLIKERCEKITGAFLAGV
jgi:DNA modification methylase